MLINVKCMTLTLLHSFRTAGPGKQLQLSLAAHVLCHNITPTSPSTGSVVVNVSNLSTASAVQYICCCQKGGLLTYEPRGEQCKAVYGAPFITTLTLAGKGPDMLQIVASSVIQSSMCPVYCLVFWSDC